MHQVTDPDTYTFDSLCRSIIMQVLSAYSKLV